MSFREILCDLRKGNELTRERLLSAAERLEKLQAECKAGPTDRVTRLRDLLLRLAGVWGENPAGRLRRALGSLLDRLLKHWHKTWCGRLIGSTEKLLAGWLDSVSQWNKELWKPARSKLERSLGIEPLEKRVLLSAQPTPLYWYPGGNPNGTGSWDTTNKNWSPNANGTGTPEAWPANGTSYCAVFGGSGGSATIDVLGGVTASSIQFSAYYNTISGSSSDTLNFPSAGGSITFPSGGSATITAVLTGGNLTVSGGSGGTLTLGGANSYSGNTTINGATLVANAANVLPSATVVSLGGSNSSLQVNVSQNIAGLSGGSGGSVVLYGTAGLTVNAAGTTDVFSGTISNYSGGTGGLTVGSGTQVLTGTNTYTGPTTIDGTGTTLQVGNGSSSGGSLSTSSTISIANGDTLALCPGSGGMNFPNTISTISGNAQIAVSGSGTVTLGTNNSAFAGSVLITSGTLQISLAYTLPAPTMIYDNSILALCPSSALAFGNTISGSGSVVVGVSGGSGGGSVTLIGTNNNYANGLTLNSGVTLDLDCASALGSSSSTLTINGGTLDNLDSSLTSLSNPMKWNGNFTYAGTNPLTFSGNVNASGGRQVTVPTGTTLTLDGQLAISSGGGLTFSGGGTLALTPSGGANSYSTTTINAGVLIASSGGLGNGTVTINNSTLDATSNVTLDAGIAVGGAAMVEVNSSYTLTATGGITSMSGGLTVSGGGELALAGASASSAGNIVINGAALAASVRNALPNGTVVSLTNGGSLALSANQTIGGLSGSSGTGITLNGCQLTVNFTGGSGSTFGGAISGIGSGGLAVGTGMGGGTLTLTGTSTYTGVTTVNSGATLCVNAPGSITSAVTLADGTLCGTGTTGPVIMDSNSILSAGQAGAGTLNVGTSLTMQAGANFDPVLSTNSSGVCTTNLLNVTGSVNLGITSGGAFLNPSWNFVTTPAPGTVFVIVESEGLTGTFYDQPQGSALTTPGGVIFCITYDYDPASANPFDGKGNDMALVVSTPPTANADTYMTDENQEITGHNVLSDGDDHSNNPGDPPLSVASVSGTSSNKVPSGGSAEITTVAGGSLTMHSSGDFTYTPATNFTGCDGSGGSSQNTYVAFDGIQDSWPAPLQFVVNPVLSGGGITQLLPQCFNMFPVMTFTQAGNTTNTGNYTAMIDWNDGTLPTGGQITVNSQGVFTVLASHNYAYSVSNPSITVTINDTQSGTRMPAYPVKSSVQLTNQLYWAATNQGSDWSGGNWCLGSANGPQITGWIAGMDAIFPASTTNTAVNVSGDVSVNSIEFQGGETQIGSQGGGTLSLTGGQVTVDSGSDTIAANISYQGNSQVTIEVDPNCTLTLAGGISGGNGLTVAGSSSSTLILCGTASYSGTTTISNATLQLDAGPSGGSLPGAITNDGDLVLCPGVSPLDFSNAISGTGEVTIEQGGGGSVTLDGANSYGVTVVDSGVLLVENSSGPGSSVMIDGGTMQVTASTCTMSQPIALGTSTATIYVNSGCQLTAEGGITGNNNVLTFSGGGTLVVDGNGGYGGITVNRGNLEIYASGSMTGDIAVNGTLALYPTGGGLVLSGNISGSGTITVNGGNVTLSGGTNTCTVQTTINSGTLAVGAGGLNGPVTINNNATLEALADFSLNQGISLAGSGGTIAVDTGQQLSLTGSITAASGGSLTLSGGGVLLADAPNVLPNGTLLNLSGGTQLQLNANQTIGGLSGIDGTSVVLNNASQLTVNVPWGSSDVFAGAISNGDGSDGGLTIGLSGESGGTQTLTGTNTYLGSTTIYGGTLCINADTALGSVSGPLVFGGSGGTLQAGVNGIALYHTMTINYGATATIDTQSYSMSIAGSINNPIGSSGSSGGLTKIGSGMLTLSGDNSAATNTYCGGTRVNVGTLDVQWPELLPMSNNGTWSDVTVSGGATLAVTVGDGSESWPSFAAGDIAKLLQYANFATNSALGIDTSEAVSGFTYGNTISGSLGLVKLGLYTLTLSGQNSYSGGTTVVAGTLEAQSPLALPQSNSAWGNVTVSGGATLAVMVGTDWSSSNINILTNSATFAAGSMLGIDTTNVGSNGFSYPYNLSGPFGLINLGPNPLTLTCTNSYSGGTTVDYDGTLQVESTAALGTSSSPLTVNSGELEFNCSGANSVTVGSLSGSGGVIKTTATSGTTTLIVDQTNNLEYCGEIEDGPSADMALTKNGGGTLILSGANTYSGPTNIDAGKLILDSGGKLGNTSINVASGATFAINPGTGAIAAGTTTTGSPGATLTLSGGSTLDMTNGGATGTFDLQEPMSFAGPGLSLQGATLDFGINSSGANQIDISGSASVSGKNIINVIPEGDYLSTQTYPLISADSGGISGGTFEFSNGLTQSYVMVGDSFYGLTLGQENTEGTESETVTVTCLTLPTVETITSPDRVTGTTAALSVTDEATKSDLTYAWSTVSMPGGASPVTFSENQVNAGVDTVTATFHQAGNYTLQVTVSDPFGLSVTSSVVVEVDQTLTSIAVTPPGTTDDPVPVPVNSTQPFTAVGEDQFNQPMPSGAVTWSATGGSITYTEGQFTAPADTTASGSPITVTATANGTSVSGTAKVAVIDAAPTLAASPAAAPTSVVGTTTYLSVLGADDEGESNLTYHWSTTSGSPGGVSFSANGTNAAKNTIATFTQPGSYTFRVKMTDPAGQWTTSTMSASVTVVQTPTSIVVSPPAPTVDVCGPEPFSASLLDQFGDPISNPSLTWTQSGGQSISGGVFTASSLPGSAVVTATADGLSGSTTMNVYDPGPTVYTPATTTTTSDPVTGMTAALDVLGYENGVADPNLTYTWSTTGTAPALVNFSPNGGTGAYETTATFSQPGAYDLVATITDPAGLSTTSSVAVYVIASPNAAPSTTLLTSSLNPVPLGQAVTITATVSPAGFDGKTPGGSVTFYDGSTLLGLGLPSSTCAGEWLLTTSGLLAGSHSITAVYTSSDGLYAASTSAPLLETATTELYWDPANIGDDFSSSESSWNVGSATGPVIQGWIPGCDAVVPAGTTLHVSSNVSVNSIEFQGDGAHIDSDGGTLSFPAAGGAIIVDSGAATIAAEISSGEVIKSGPGNLTLAGANSFAGGADVEDGTLVAGCANALGSGVLTVNAGEFDLGGYDINIPELEGGGGTIVNSGSSSNTLKITGGTTINGFPGGTMFFGGTFSGGGLTVDMANSGTLSLSGDNSGFTGPINVQTGTLDLEGPLGVTPTTASGATVIGPYAQGTINPSTIQVTPGAEVDAVQGIPTDSVPLATFTDSSGNTNPSAYSVLINWGDGSPTDVTTGEVTSDPKTAGVFDVTSSGYEYAKHGTYNISVTVADTGGSQAAADTTAVVSDATPTITSCTGDVDAADNNTTATLSVVADYGDDPDMTYTWAVDDLPAGVPTPTFSDNGDNTAATTTVTFGQAFTSYDYDFNVTATNADGVPVTSSDLLVPVPPKPTSVLTSYGAMIVGDNVGSTTLPATVLDQFGNPIPGDTVGWLLTAGALGMLSGGAAYVAPTTAGAKGTDNLTATYGSGPSLTANLPVTVGTLCVCDPTNLAASGQSLLLDGGTLQWVASADTAVETIAFPIVIGPGDGTIVVPSGETLNVTGAISGTGTLTVSGGGTLVASGNDAGFTGNFILAGGTFSLGSANALGTGNKIEFAGGTLQYTSSNTTDYSSQFSTVAGQDYAIDTNGQSITLAAPLSGAGLTKIGTGTLTLAGSNDFTTGVTLAGGTLSLGNANALSGGGMICFAGGTLQFSSSNTADCSARFTVAPGQNIVIDTNGQNVTLTTNLSGAGLTKIGAGTLTLAGSNDFTTGVTLAGGTLSLGNANALSGGGPICFAGGTLQFTSSNTADCSARFTVAPGQNIVIDTNGQNVTLGSALSGPEGLTKVGGSGTLIVSGENSLTGDTEVDAGTLQVGSDSALPTGALTVNSKLDLQTYTATVASLSGISGGAIIGETRALLNDLQTGAASFLGTITAGLLNMVGSGPINPSPPTQAADRPVLLKPIPDQTLTLPGGKIPPITLSTYFADPNASNDNALTYSCSVSNSALLSKDIDTGQLQLTAAGSSPGWVTVTVTASKGDLTTSDTFSVNVVAAAPQSPVEQTITEDSGSPYFTNVSSWLSSGSVYTGNTVTFMAQATDPNGSSDQSKLVYSLVLPSSMNGGDDSGGQRATIGPSTGVFSWTPSLLLAGQTVTFQVVATDPDGLSASQSVSISVLEVPQLSGLSTWTVSTAASDALQVPAPNHWPQFADVYNAAPLGTPMSEAQITGATCAFNLPQSSNDTAVNSCLTINSTTGVMTWMPSANVLSYAGSHQVTVTLRYGTETATACFTLNVTLPSYGPYFLPGLDSTADAPGFQATHQYMEYSTDTSESDPVGFYVVPQYQGPGPLAYSLQPDPNFSSFAQGTIYSIGGQEYYRYLGPPPSANQWSVLGADIVVTGPSGVTATMQVVISLHEGTYYGDTPYFLTGCYALSNSLIYQPNTVMTVSATGQGYPDAAVEKQYYITTYPTHGTIALASDFLTTGNFTYTPNAGFSGIDTLQFDCHYSYTDGPQGVSAPDPLAGITNVATVQIGVGPLVSLNVAGQFTSSSGGKEAPLQIDSTAAGSRYGMPIAAYQQNAALGSSDKAVKTATLTITNPWMEPYSGYWSLNAGSNTITLNTTSFSDYVHVYLYSGGTYTELFPNSSMPVNLAAGGSQTFQLVLEGVASGVASGAVNLPVTLSGRLGDVSQDTLPSSWLADSVQIDVVGPALRFQAMTVGEEAAGQVGFVKLNDDYDLNLVDANNEPLPDYDAGSPLTMPNPDPDWAKATLEIASAGSLSAQWALNIPDDLRVWEQAGNQWVSVVSGETFAAGSGPINLWVEGTQLGSAQLTANVDYYGNSVSVTYSSSVKLQVVSDSLVVGGVTALDVAQNNPAAAPVPIDSGYELGKTLPAARGTPTPVPDNGMFEGYPVDVAPGIGTSQNPQAVDDALVAATFNYNLGSGVLGAFWISPPGGAVLVWTDLNKNSYYAVPTSPGQALDISGSGSVSLLIQGISNASPTLSINVIPRQSRYWLAGSADATTEDPLNGATPVKGSAWTVSHGDAVARAPITVGAPNPAQVFASDAYASATATGDTGEFVISRGEGNTEGQQIVGFSIDTSSPNAAVYNTDYTLSGGGCNGSTGTVTIPDGQSSVILYLLPKGTSQPGWDKTVTLTLNQSSDGEDDDDSDLPNQSATVTILNGVGITSIVDQNADTTSTGQSVQTVGDWLVSAGVQGGSVQLVPTIGTSDYAPQYVGDDSIYPIIAVNAQMPDSVSGISSVEGQLYLANLPATTRYFNLSCMDSTHCIYAFQADASSLPTGEYPYTIVFTVSEIDGQSHTRTYQGQIAIVNRTAGAGQNALGDGWDVPGLGQIVMSDGQATDGSSATADTAETPYRLAESGADTAVGAAVVRSDNSVAWYVSTSTSSTVAETADDSCPSVFSDDGAWSVDSTAGFDGGCQFATTAGATASWTLANLQPGKDYELYATWVPGPDRSSNATYSVSGATLMGQASMDTPPITIDQRYEPGTSLSVDGDDNGATWRSLGFYVAGSSGTITISLTSGSGGVTIADAVAAVDDWQFSTPLGSYNTLLAKTCPDPASGNAASLENFALRDKYGTIESFNADGMMTDSMDRLGNQTLFTYNTSQYPQQLLTVTEQGGLETTFAYNGNTLASVTDGYGNVTTYANGTVTLPAPGYNEKTPSWTFQYNALHLLSEIDAPNGNVTKLYYDAYERLQQVDDGVGADDMWGNSLETTWQLTSCLSAAMAGPTPSTPLTAAEFQATYNTYSSYDQGLATSGNPGPAAPGGIASTWTYTTDPYGYVLSLTEPATTQLDGAMADFTSALAQAIWTWTRNPDGTPATCTQPAGGGGYKAPWGALTTTYKKYDGNGNCEEIDYFDGSSELWSYDSNFSQPTSYTDRDGNTTTWTLNARGEATAEYDASGTSVQRETDFTYTVAPDDIDDLPGGLTLSQTVAANSVDSAAPGGTDAVTTVTTYYGESDDGDDDDTDDSYESGQVESVTSAYGTNIASTVQYAYDENGNLATSTDPMGNVTSYTYDNLDRLVCETDPNPGTGDCGAPQTQYRYDALGNKISESDPNGYTTKYVYDELDRLAAVTLPPAGGDTVKTPQDPATTYYFYTPTGQTSDVVDPLGCDTHSDYDARGELIAVQQEAPGVAMPAALSSGASGAWAAGSWTASLTSAPCTYYSYDELGNESKMIDPLGHVTDYVYDDNNRQTNVIQMGGANDDQPSLITSTQYYPGGDVQSVTTPGPNGGVTTSYTYDALGRLSTTTTSGITGSSGNTGTLTDTRTYDLRDNLLTDTQQWTPVSGCPVADAQTRVTTNYYDQLDRCYETVSPSPGYGEPQLTTYQFFDADGDVTATLAMGTGAYAQGSDPGRLTLTTYDNLGRVTQVIQPDNVTNGTFTSDGTSYAALQTAVNMATENYTAASDLLTLSSPVTTYHYDADGNQTSVQQRVYDSTTSSMQTVTTSTEYDALDRPWLVTAPSTDDSGAITIYDYDLDGEQTAVRQALTQVVDDDLPAMSVDELLDSYTWRVTTSSYDNLGRVYQTQVTTPDAATQTTQQYYDADGNVCLSIDTMGRVTVNKYDSYNRLTSTSVRVDGLANGAPPTTAQTTYHYYPGGKVMNVTTPAGKTSYVYDDFGNAAQTTQPNGAVTATLYDGFGELVQVTDPDQNVTQYAYDGMGNKVLNRIFSNGNSSTGTRLDWTYFYDAFGDQVQSIDRDGHEIDSSYDSLGRKLSDTWVNGSYSSSYTYNALSEPITAGDNNSQYTYNYNDQCELQSQTISYTNLSNTYLMSYGYNLQGQRTSLKVQTPAMSPTTTVLSNAYTVNGLGQVTAITQTGNGLTQLNVNMLYTPDGQPWAVFRSQTSGSSTQQMAESVYGYYKDGMLDDLAEWQGNTLYRTDQYQYNTAGLTVSEYSESPQTDPANVDNSYVYDASGQLTQSTNNITGTVTPYNYGPNGNPMPAVGTVVGANNQITQDTNGVYQYDKQGNLTTQWTQDAGSQTIPQGQGPFGNMFQSNNVTLSTTGDYDLKLGGLVINWTGSGAVPTELTLTVTVTMNSFPPPHQPSMWEFTLPVTLVGGRLVVQGSTDLFFALPSGFPTSAPLTLSASFSVPNDPTSSTDIKLNGGSAYLYHETSITVNTYDYLNRLVEVQQYLPDPGGAASFTRPTDGVAVRCNLSQTINYTYDVLGNRIAESVTPAGGTTTTTWYINDGTHIALELTQQGAGSATVSQVRLNAAAVDQVLAVHDLASEPGADEVYWLLANRQGTVLDEQTVPVGTENPVDMRVGFSTVGAPLSTNPLVPVVIYAGQECDLTTNLNYDEARFYDPGMARFINPDPLGLVADTNEYRYCDNSWPNETDPTGEWAGIDDLVATVGGAVFGVAAQGISDLVSGQYSGWETYVGSAVNGAVTAEASLYVGPVAGAMLGAAAGNVTAQGLRIADGNQQSFNWNSLTVDTAMGGLGGLGGALAGKALGAVGNNLNAGLQKAFPSLSEQAICRIASPILGAGTGAIMGGAFGATGGGIQGYIQNGWNGVWAGALNGVKVGMITGASVGLAQGLIAPYICFTAGTLVHSAAGKRPIETLRVGQRTLTEGTKDAWDLPGDDPTQIDPATWRLVRLQTAKPAGSDNIVDAELLRPLAWIAACGALVGSRIHFELAELGIDGPACVLAIEPCPEIEPGRGRVITGTFTTARCSVLELRLASGKVLEPTPPHRFFSETRQDWVAAQDLRGGEYLGTASGQAAAVESIGLRAGEHRVYNLEVEQEHQFYVGESGVLVHNEYAGNYGKLKAAKENGLAGGSDGTQIHHLNQDAVYGREPTIPGNNGTAIPYSEGAATLLEGGTATLGSEHNINHRVLEGFWDNVAEVYAREGIAPTNAEYGAALEQAMLEGGMSPRAAYELAQSARRQRIAFGHLDDDPVPNIPNAFPPQFLPGGPIR
jgi:RHS repeat-associated protein